MRLTTWNINSVRLRLPLALRLIAQQQPDLLLLQETKVRDALFPRQAFLDQGYEHQLIHGEAGYNGIAILSRLPFAAPGGTFDWCATGQCRHGVIELPGGIEVHNLYIPAGGDVPDRAVNTKFAHKLDFLACLTEHFARHSAEQRTAIIAGDFNVAPLEHDVWSHKQLLKVVSHTPIEVEALTRLREGHGWLDAGRHLTPEPTKLYTWWSYRNRDWQVSNRGRRLDHVWLSPSLTGRLRHVTTLVEARNWPQPSDHVPVSVDLDL